MSSPQFTLYSHRGPGPNPPKCAVLLENLGLTYRVIALDFGDDKEKGVKGSEFLKLNPNGRVPALIDHGNDDFVVWESGAILYYLAEKYDPSGIFLGKSVEERAIVLQWLTHQLSGIGPVQGNLNYYHHYWEKTYGEKPQKSVLTRFEGENKRLYTLLEKQLEDQAKRGSSFVALDRPTIADYAFWPWVRIAHFGKFDLTPYPTVQRWCETIEQDAKTQAALKKLEEANKA
ncbi:glutathione S-transferase [Violaceomyces palustris]|uniref:Glutathione S-transferase n=1 Tax=Violaceomyces palustris TaxID=1673888 RepID=A0ACD0NX73_9BASI|nr:glutathione S-transferase [Violaceomyces palustris]